ncbi:hypothetical protein RSOLAG22IIIB_08318 [Rhizoctonia solani]|uniref:Uncharacterized protein n=1 Tax=Rhizoctonia solani TaxID=456999 RepID=A0A0K6FSL6_9AGAM|nr:hypothetical protein RSOLAG22IIIB_08318 [Rhizoctonia solani]
MSIVSHLEAFRIDNAQTIRVQPDVLANSSLVHLRVLAPRLVKLKYLHWDIWFVYDAQYLKLFQTQRQTLERLKLVVPASNPGSDQYTSSLNFSNLSHISLLLPHITLTSFCRGRVVNVDAIKPSTARAARTIIRRWEEWFRRWGLTPISAVNVVSALGNTLVFPHLRVFRIYWANDEYLPEIDNSDWNGFFTPPDCDSHPLRSFFLRHNKIEDLALGWTPDTAYHGKIDPDEIVRLFPRLKRFEGPAFLCNAITKPDIAQNLEALVMVDMTFVGQTDWLGAMAGELRNDFILAAPGIETIECRLVVKDFVAVLIAISHTPKLRELVVDGQSWVASALDQQYKENPAHDEWVDMISRVVKRCHKLESFKNVDGWGI